MQITDLKPDTSYVFVVRAENSQGISVPSEMSEEAHTQGTHLRDVPIHQINEGRSRLATKVILLKNLTPTSSTTVKITWEVRNSIISIAFLLKAYILFLFSYSYIHFFLRFLWTLESFTNVNTVRLKLVLYILTITEDKWCTGT